MRPLIFVVHTESSGVPDIRASPNLKPVAASAGDGRCASQIRQVLFQSAANVYP
jgi:hypothetical protein